MKKNACQMPKSVLYMERDLEKDKGHSLVLVLRRSGGQGRWGPRRRATDRRRRTRKGPQPACVRSPFYSSRGGTRKGRRMNSHPAVVPSSRRGKNLQLVAKEEEPGCPKRVSGRHVVRGRQSSPIPAQASRVSVAVRGAPG